MGMDAGPVTGKRDAVLLYKAVLYGRGNGCSAEYLMQKLFIIKREFIPGNSGFCHNFSDFRMPVRKFNAFSRLIGRLPVFAGGKKIFSARLLELFVLEPETVNEIIIRAEGRQGVR